MDRKKFCDFQKALALVKKTGEDLEQAESAELMAEELEDDYLNTSPIYQWMKEGGNFYDMTNFYENTIMEIWRPLDSRMEGEKHRGPNAHTTTMDHLLLFLVWLKTGLNYAIIGHMFNISPTLVEDKLNRVRGHLYQSLYDRWWYIRMRPQLERVRAIPPYGLIIDEYTTQIGRPVMNFENAKAYYDGKNEMYGLKVEIAVHVVPPHYCMFVSDAVPASKHDYMLHKETYTNYLPYLKMTPDELARAPDDFNVHYWCVMGDKAYVGSNDDTEPERRLVPYRGNKLSPLQAEWNPNVNRRRVVVEQFLGRLSILWTVFRCKWRYDHKHFDMDMAIACMLTNHHLESTELHDEDHEMLLRLRIMRKQKKQQKDVARKQSVRISKRNRKLRAQLELGLEDD